MGGGGFIYFSRSVKKVEIRKDSQSGIFHSFLIIYSWPTNVSIIFYYYHSDFQKLPRAIFVFVLFQLRNGISPRIMFS